MSSAYVKPAVITDGRLGHLTPEQTEKLQQFWVRLYDIFDGKTPFDQTAPSSFKGQARDEDAGAAPAPKASWFGRGKSASESSSAPVPPRFTGQDLYVCFWKLTMMDHPDLIILKFIRARKWVLDDAMKMFLNALKWRIVERLDELVELSDVELDAKYPKFIEQMRIGKGYLRGADPLDRPMSVVNTRLHHKADQPAETIHRFTLYTMECGRTVLPQGAETVIVIFDLSNFGLDNMDWGFVRLFVQCFESYYPETLGVCVVHRAPFVFWGLWKLIQPLLDPVVATKFVFTRNNEELHKVVPRERLPITHYGGLDDWTYKYVPAAPGEDDVMKDVAKKEELLTERHALEETFDRVTREWIKNVNGKNAPERDEIAQQLREQYTRLSPYVRATNLYKRWGVAVDGRVNWTYNVVPEQK
ncbi:MAG: CRAL-TRIO domain-containing protein [Podila humilis]|nr:MAG: CRAL-TRIO domain-containing protein [Podila humilis]